MTGPDTLRRVRIVATIGPASVRPETLREMVAAGMNAVRLNCSHGTPEERARVIGMVREIAAEANRPVAVLLDLQGPRIRTGALRGNKPVHLHAGDQLIITTEPTEGDSIRISSTYAGLAHDVKPGMTILIADGTLQLVVQEVRDKEVLCEVVVGGELGEHKGINIPAASISAPALTEKDEADLRFGVVHEVDYVALSFVRSAADIRYVRQMLHQAGARIPLIAKIERREAIDHLNEILEEADGVMVARGDLGVETSSADVPILQKRIIAASNQHLKLDITATHMLESMVVNPRPTRAEAADVANAVFDGTDALMLSAETAIGRHPALAVRMMDAIARRAEEEMAEFGRTLPRSRAALTITTSTARAACLTADEIGARAIVVFTQSGQTALLVAQHRPRTPIIALTPQESTWRRLALVWGVSVHRIPTAKDVPGMFAAMERELLAKGILARGNLVVTTFGTTEAEGTTNLMRIYRIGEKPPAGL